MTDWLCPNCGGGFPTPAAGEGNGSADECPWCGQATDAGYDGDHVRVVHESTRLFGLVSDPRD